MPRFLRHLLLAVIMSLPAGCGSEAPVERARAAAADAGDTSRTGEDVGASADADAGTDANGEQFLHRWEPTGGPFGGLHEITRVFDTIYLHGKSRHSDRIAAVSTDGGSNWRRPSAEQANADLAEQTTLVYESAAQGVYIVVGSKLYRRVSADAEWELMNEDVPNFYDFHATGDILVLLADWQHAIGIMVSEDHGRSWDFRMSDSMSEATGIAAVATWRGRIYAAGYGSPMFVSDDAGRSWTQPVESNLSLLLRARVDAGGTLATTYRSEDVTYFATSTDGVTWERTTLSGEAASVIRLVATDNDLYGITGRGAVGRMTLEGDWTQVTGPRDDFIRRMDNIESLGDGFIILNGGIARQWSPASGWQTLEFGLRSDGVTLGAGHAWLPHSHLLRLDEEGWTLATPGNWSEDSFFGTSQDAFFADYCHCIYRRGEQGWGFVVQWADGRLYDNCEGDRASYGRLTDVTSFDDEFYFSKTEAVYHTPGGPAGGGVMSLERLAPLDDTLEDVRTLTSTADRLWLVSKSDLYSSDGQTTREETAEIERDTGLEIVKVLTAAAFDEHVFARVLTPGRHMEVVYRSDHKWKLAPQLEVEDAFALSINADGVWSVSDGRAWNYSPGADRWREISGGLPENARVSQIRAGAAGVFASVEELGVWRLNRDDR